MRTGAVRLALAATVAVLMTGCGMPKVRDAKDFGRLQQMIATPGKPVLVDYYKQGCEKCNAFELTLSALAQEYKGRVVTTKFLLLKANGQSTAPEFATKNDIIEYPTVILYANGKEVKRFVQNYTYGDYNKAIDDCLKSPAKAAP